MITCFMFIGNINKKGRVKQPCFVFFEKNYDKNATGPLVISSFSLLIIQAL